MIDWEELLSKKLIYIWKLEAGGSVEYCSLPNSLNIPTLCLNSLQMEWTNRHIT